MLSWHSVHCGVVDVVSVMFGLGLTVCGAVIARVIGAELSTPIPGTFV